MSEALKDLEGALAVGAAGTSEPVSFEMHVHEVVLDETWDSVKHIIENKPVKPALSIVYDVCAGTGVLNDNEEFADYRRMTLEPLYLAAAADSLITAEAAMRKMLVRILDEPRIQVQALLTKPVWFRLASELPDGTPVRGGVAVVFILFANYSRADNHKYADPSLGSVTAKTLPQVLGPSWDKFASVEGELPRVD